jgi:hypothetical protein
MICLPILHMELQSRNHHKRDYISIYEKANWGVHDTWDFSVANLPAVVCQGQNYKS